MTENSLVLETKIDGFDFNWDLEKGLFNFEGDDAVLFWIKSAMKSFFDTIEEISGKETSSIVLETTGFRQGMVVGTFFKDLGLPIEEVANIIPRIYASAGWGKYIITDLDPAAKTARVRALDSWEYKINKEQGKNESGTFLPGHFAGIFSAVFGTSLWYKKAADQLAGQDYTELDYFPSSVTVEENIHALARREESKKISELEKLVEDRTIELKQLVKEISSPVIPVLDGIVVVPLLGRYDEFRSEELVDKTLHSLPKHQADCLILDLTGLNQSISAYTVEFLSKLAAAANLIGTETILVGISPELGTKITETNFNLSKFNCFTNLQHGIYYALSKKGRKIF
ncbi:STAS domain-containing protein [Cytobacillus firmus]|uniref:STAS domain-containing protein n=1 Tax=Cytobacillus firmus TaxID=1399 RepID=UPI00207ADA0A|nr:STAS domain-containing protein [Cytobacillus firmus]URM32798.1 STAS domain-containing protein [Cytobacillus firmus]USK39343.1 STAS domain-containing protein [Cytobacillus firmus]WHY62187.1 STAS domain-containing protein [Cytobacillus firmus]